MIKNTKRIFSIFFIFIFVFCSHFNFDISAAENFHTIIYVSPNGNDLADGSENFPLKSLEGARNKIRDLREKNVLSGEVSVFFRGGEYLWDKTVEFNSLDSGSEDFSVKYCAYPGETPVFTGGTRISGKEFSKVEDSQNAYAFSKNAVGEIFQINIKKYFNEVKKGISSEDLCLLDWYPYAFNVMSGGYGKYEDYKKLFKNADGSYDISAFNEYMISAGAQNKSGRIKNAIFSVGKNPALWPARYPNKEIYDGADAENPYSVFLKTGNITKNSDGTSNIEYTDERISKYVGKDDVWFEHYSTIFYHDKIKIASVDSVNKLIKTSVPETYSLKENADFFFFNILEELDAPGEMYIDKNTGMMYVYPNGNLEASYMNISVFSGDYMIKTSGASYIEFNGITFENTQGSGVFVSGGRDVTLNCCDFYNIGNTAVIFGDSSKVGYWQLPNELLDSDGNPKDRATLIKKYYDSYKGSDKSTDTLGKNHRLVSSVIKNTGSSCVSVTGGNSWRDEESGYVIENCDISYPAVYNHTYHSAINLNNVYGLKILNNKLSHSPGQLIYGYVLKAEISGNYIYDALNTMRDNGMFYFNYTVMGLDIDIHNNFFNQIPYEKNHSGYTQRFGIYCDNGVGAGLRIRNNIFKNLTSALQKPVANSDVIGNTFVNCGDIHSVYSVAMINSGEHFMYPAVIKEDFFKRNENSVLTQNLPAKTREWFNVLTVLPVFGDGEIGEIYTELWQNKYPSVMQYLDIIESGNHKGNFFVNVRDNLIYKDESVSYSTNNFKFEDLEQYQPSGCAVDNNIYTSSKDCFEDFDNGNFELSDEFVHKNGLSKLSQSDMGTLTSVCGSLLYKEVVKNKDDIFNLKNITLRNEENKKEISDGEYRVLNISGSKKEITVNFDEDVKNTTVEIFEASDDFMKKLPSKRTDYSSKRVIAELEDELEFDKNYYISVKYGENLENKYSSYFNFEILDEFENFENSEPASLSDCSDFFKKYTDYSVEFECTKADDISVSFFLNDTYSKKWNYHNAVGRTLSTDKALWSSIYNSEAYQIENVDVEGDNSILENSSFRVNASAVGKDLSLRIYNDKNEEKLKMLASLPYSDEMLKYSFGTFCVSSASDISITDLKVYKLKNYEKGISHIKILNLDFEKNADTIAHTEPTKKEVNLYDLDNNVLKTFSTDYAIIDRNTWFNGIDSSKMGMYFSGLKASFFPVDKKVPFKKIYRVDSEDSSKLLTDDNIIYEMEFFNDGYKAKVNDAFLLNKSSEENKNTPDLNISMDKKTTSFIRFAAQTNSGSLTVKINYTDGFIEEHKIQTGLCGNIVYTGYNNNYHKYFSLEDEEVTAGIIGQYLQGHSAALYPYDYYSKIGSTNADYCATKDFINTASTDIRISEKALRYYNPRIFLFEVKVSEDKIPESVTLSLDSSYPMLIYSVCQGIKEEKIFSVSEFFISDKEATVKLNDENISYIPYFALYSSDNNLISVSSQVNNGYLKADISGNYDVSYAKVFFWNKQNIMNPEKNAFVIKISGQTE